MPVSSRVLPLSRPASSDRVLFPRSGRHSTLGHPSWQPRASSAAQEIALSAKAMSSTDVGSSFPAPVGDAVASFASLAYMLHQ